MDPNRNFPYFSIDTANQEIRLLTIVPGEATDPISCYLTSAYLGDPPDFKALSYTWTAANPARPISIDGHTFFVRINLEKALRRFRKLDEEVCIWIDAICINQLDLDERSQHILYMHEVYGKAEEVMVWLGEAADGSDVIVDRLVSLWMAARSDGPSLEFEKILKELQRPQMVKCFAKFFARPWWGRVWTMQEFLWARNLYLYCGQMRIPAGVLNATSRIVKDQQILAPHTADSMRVHMSGSMQLDFLCGFTDAPARPGVEPVIDALRHVRIRSATDPRDKVFALANIFAESDINLKPDYSKTIADVFTHTALELIKASKRLDILSLCDPSCVPVPQNHLKGYMQLAGTEDLPSWVPDWARQQQVSALAKGIFDTPIEAESQSPGYKADSGENANYSYDPVTKNLDVAGFFVASVSECCPTLLGVVETTYDTFREKSIYQYMETWISGKVSSKFGQGESVTDLLEDLITAGRRSLVSSEPIDESEKTRFRRWRSSTDDCVIPQDFAKRVLQVMLNRNMFVSEDGIIGVSHWSVAPGDEIAIILGSSVPQVVRRTAWDKARYQLVGECYMPGFMQGEAFQAFFDNHCDMETITLA